jgi:hypothetical protein
MIFTALRQFISGEPDFFMAPKVGAANDRLDLHTNPLRQVQKLAAILCGDWPIPQR